MKGEKTNIKPALDMTNPEGTAEQSEAAKIIGVWLNNGQSYDIVHGSFHYYVTDTERPVPFVRFDAYVSSPVTNQTYVQHIECFPASLTGWVIADE